MQITRAKTDDFLAIAALDRISWPSAENKQPVFIPDGEHTWRLWCEYAVVFCAKKDEKVIGAVLAFPTNDPALYALHKIFVADEYRGKSIGTQLLKRMVEELSNRNLRSFLTVNPNNDAALKLYKSLGFSVEKSIKGYYRSYEDRLILQS